MLEMPRRRAIALPVIVALGGCASLSGDANRTVDGVVDRKLVLGQDPAGDDPADSDDDGPPTTELVVVDNDGTVEAANDDYRERATDGDAVAVTDALAADLREDYDDVQYLVAIELESPDYVNDADPGEGVTYRADRTAFNAAIVDRPLTYEVSDGGNNISEIVDASRRVNSYDTRPSPD